MDLALIQEEMLSRELTGAKKIACQRHVCVCVCLCVWASLPRLHQLLNKIFKLFSASFFNFFVLSPCDPSSLLPSLFLCFTRLVCECVHPAPASLGHPPPARAWLRLCWDSRVRWFSNIRWFKFKSSCFLLWELAHTETDLARPRYANRASFMDAWDEISAEQISVFRESAHWKHF